jgi:hypothetical protein
MGNRPNKKFYNGYYTEYFSELKKLIDAQNEARKYFPLINLRPGEEPLELTSEGKKVFRRLNRAYKLYAKRYKAWRKSLKTSGM